MKFDGGITPPHPQRVSPGMKLMMIMITKYKPFLCLRITYAHKSEQVLVCPQGLKDILKKYIIINKFVNMVTAKLLGDVDGHSQNMS